MQYIFRCCTEQTKNVILAYFRLQSCIEDNLIM